MDKITPEQRSKIMRAIKSKNTKSEVLLAKALWKRGHRYRKHDKSILGTPDLSFKKYKIAIFVDSEFFHGKDWETKRPKSNTEYWIPKIEKNMKRDNEVNIHLIQSGWTVIRFWSNDVQKQLFTSMRSIEKQIEDKQKRIFYL